MKKTFILLAALIMISCSGEIYEDELRIGENGLAYVGDDKLYSGDVLDKYGEKLGTYKKGIKDGAWTEIDYKDGTRRKANYIRGIPEGEQITYVFPGPMDNNKRLEYINYENGNPVGIWTQWGRDSENRIRKSGEITFDINKKLIKKGLTVTDHQVLKAIKYAYMNLGLILEPGGAVGLAAVLNQKTVIKNKTVVVVLSGSNIDPKVLKTAIK